MGLYKMKLYSILLELGEGLALLAKAATRRQGMRWRSPLLKERG
jgi:hypothetical protein